jgi:hypothetical protein
MLMNVVLWILQGLLSATILFAGATKVIRGKEKLREEPRMAWVEDFSDKTVRRIGRLEVAAAHGLVLPWVLWPPDVLTPIAALGVVAIMLGAMYTHRRRGEMQQFAGNVVIGVVALVVAIGRFGGL